jgi:high-affinity nickel-transport protein
LAYIPETLAGACALAFAFGAQHGFDADHLATIDGLVRRNAMDRPRVAHRAGLFFSAGHGLVVLAVAAVAALAAGAWKTPEWLKMSGLLVSVTFLLALAIINLRALVTAPADAPVAPVGLRAKAVRRLFSLRSATGIMGVGALFALSFDTIAQAALFAVLAEHLGGVGETLLAAGCFVVGMAAVDGLNGWVITRMVRAADRRAALASRIMTAAIGSISIGVACLVLFKLAAHPLAGWVEAHGMWVSAAVITVCVAALGAAFLVSRSGTREGAAAPPS